MGNYIYLAIWPFDVIGDAIATFFYYILLWLNAIIYSFISFVYQIFLVLAQGGQLFDDRVIDGLTSRIYVIIGVVVLFLVAYSLLKSMVNPDEALKGKKSAVTIVKDVIISIVLIAIVPYIFEFAFQFQNSLLINNTIGKIIAGTTDDGSESENKIRNGGYIMASTVWQAFLYPADGYCRTRNEELNGVFEGTTDECEVLEVDGSTYGELWERAEENTTFFELASLGKFIVKGQLNYLFIIDSIVGVLVLFVLVIYCIDMAIRLVKLAVFQLIAPIPIFARIIPNEQANKVFGNWLKATISTFVEVFIRIAILYFAILIITTTIESIDDIIFKSFNGSASIMVVGVAKVLLIVGIILFVKQAPQILKDITGLDSGKYGKSLIKGIGTMATTFGGGTTAAIRSVVNDKDKPIAQRLGRGALAGLSGSARGFRQGTKTEKFGDIPKAAGTAASNALGARARREAAGGWGNYLSQWIENKKSDAMGWASGSFEAQQKMLEQVNEFVKDAKAVKSTSEGFIREKKYLFKYGENDELGTKEIEVDSGLKDKNGKAIIEKRIVPRVRITQDTTLSELDAMIQTLKSSGDVEDAKIAAALESKMNQKIKTIGKQLAAVSIDRSKATEFDAKFSSAASKGILSEAKVALDQTESAYEIVQKKFVANQALDGVQGFKNDQEIMEEYGGRLTTDNVSKLADYLESQSSKIQENIKLEQERRKAASPKGKDK